MSTTVTSNEQRLTLGTSVPPFTAHAISVSLPTWDDNVGYERGEKRVVDAMVSGYPRFFIHLSIQKLARICEQKFGVQDERCLLCPTRKIAEHCRAFMIDRSTKAGSPVPVRLVQFLITPEDEPQSSSSGVELHIVLFPGDAFPLAKQFWQHTGICISSRLAERCLSMLPEEGSEVNPPMSPFSRLPCKGANRHYSAKTFGKSPPVSPALSQIPTSNETRDDLSRDQVNYVEERYGRNLPFESAAAAKRAMRRRIAGVLVRDSPSDWSTAGGHETELGPSTRGVEDVTEDDVFLYSTGMAAIWNAHQLALSVRPVAKSICFGFPYADTLKVLEKWGPGCYFLGHGLDEDIDELEALLEKESASSTNPPLLSLFTEFPSNPLLRCPDLPRLCSLADKYDFLIVVDETIGNFVNVEVLPYADIVVSSLSKVFSGDSNVMGGSLILNPRGRHYAALKSHMVANFEDSYYDEDAIYMERNSRDFKRRIEIIDANALAVCSFLRSRSLADPAPPRIPSSRRCSTQTVPRAYQRSAYGRVRRVVLTDVHVNRGIARVLRHAPVPQRAEPGHELHAGVSVRDPGALCGVGMGGGYGIEEGLVRVSVGMEDTEVLLRGFEKALAAAEAVVQDSESPVEI
ncbi:putative cystathionine gamma-synthase [Grifola frondosa]|uniref:cystathionine gamma-synthase n=1 Tax=Grifola frondosa TaxID=5627 RepID=A0A1C7LTK7_GRIFR|nr:putative cystathionine gamma-synthase [Grifola frondosa]